MNGRKKCTDLSGGILPALFVCISSFCVFAQPLPDKIRGYKVYRDKVSVNTSLGDSEAAVRVGEPELAEVSLTGITLQLPAEFTAVYQSGKVEMITFHDLKVNGIKVEAEEYAHRFEFKKGEKVLIPKPVRIFIPASSVVKAAWKEMTESKAEWSVTGRVFVFGRFRRYGFHHKRVVPIDVDLTIKNPLK
jgi:hypothetical protein